MSALIADETGAPPSAALSFLLIPLSPLKILSHFERQLHRALPGRPRSLGLDRRPQAPDAAGSHRGRGPAVTLWLYLLQRLSALVLAPLVIALSPWSFTRPATA